MTVYLPPEVVYLGVFLAGCVTGAVALFFVAIQWGKRGGS